MIIHCDACGKAVSNRLENCPFCTFMISARHDNEFGYKPTFEELIPSFKRKTIAS
ncbi:MAG: hypothetical protein P1V18_01945 [Candidatus Gracilibacteria bacterium]|nr:hypothetical protein [Candidatus Gracilibacteria bacterium]